MSETNYAVQIVQGLDSSGFESPDDEPRRTLDRPADCGGSRPTQLGAWTGRRVLFLSMDVHKAKAFLAVAEDLHFGRAATRLHMAQPPLSRLIRALEGELGSELFQRNPRKVTLTAVGEALVEPARELVMQSERMIELVRRVQQGETGRVRLGFAGASVNAVVSALARRVRSDRPGLTLELYGSQLSHPGLEGLRAGALDAVVGRWDMLPGDVESRVVAEEELLVALPDNHRLATAQAVSMSDIADEPWIVLPGGIGATLSNRLHLLGIRGRFVPRIVQTAVDSATQLLLVDAGVGIALTFSGVRENVPAHAVVFRPLTPGLGSVEVRLAWRKTDDNPALSAVIQISEAVYPCLASNGNPGDEVGSVVLPPQQREPESS